MAQEDKDLDLDSLDLDADFDGLGDDDFSLDDSGDDALAGEDFNFEDSDETGFSVDDLDFQEATDSDDEGLEPEPFGLGEDLEEDLGSFDDGLSLDDLESGDMEDVGAEPELSAQDEIGDFEDDFALNDEEGVDEFSMDAESSIQEDEFSMETELDASVEDEFVSDDQVMELSEEDQEPLQFDLAGEADELEQGIEVESLEELGDLSLADDESTLLLSNEEVADEFLEDSESLGFQDEPLEDSESLGFQDEPLEEDVFSVVQEGGLLDLDSPFEEVSANDLDLDDLSLIPEELDEPATIDPTPGLGLATAEVEERSEQKIAPELLMSLEHEISIEVGKATLKGNEIADLSYGSVILLDKEAGDAVDLTLNGQVLAHGEVVLINNDRLGVRVIGLNAG